ncbi:uncharacterized protein LOC131841086 [Achroia grisella]|uniref:uncharacterized protein LOC131841086 n=1 Tax=Achroia grisella TaxID=688607 RepID=UPI0027D280C8|nr:uncharacterized protein LOC131841086 [Achroia grisella]
MSRAAQDVQNNKEYYETIYNNIYFILSHANSLIFILFSLLYSDTTIMLVSSELRYITTFYSIIATRQKQYYNYIITVMILMCQIFTLSKSAQDVQNNIDHMKRRLCRYTIQSIINRKEYKASRNFFRQLVTRPISIRVFGFISVDMTLVPTCIGFITSYTVIALQFNNVI